MATNRFEGGLVTGKDHEDLEFFGILGGKLNTLKVEGRLSEAGAGSDFDFAEDYSSTATWASYKATAQCVIHRMVLELSLSTFTGSAAQDLTLWLGGTAQLTNGIKWGVSSASTGSPDTYASSAAKSMAQFASVHGANIFRNTYSVDGTAGDNHDSLIVVYDFKSMYGFPIRLPKNYYLGVYLNDDLATTAALSTFTGKVFGTLIFE